MITKELSEEYYKAYKEGYEDGYKEAKEVFAPTKHGRWIWRGGNLYECSECGAIVVVQDYIPIELHYFCRGCGAKMDDTPTKKVDIPTGNTNRPIDEVKE